MGRRLSAGGSVAGRREDRARRGGPAVGDRAQRGLEVLGLRPQAAPASKGGSKSTTAAETVAEWVARWLTWRTARGLSTTPHDKGRLNNYVLPTIGLLSIRTVARDDIERVVEALDRKIASTDATERISWKTAQNAWMLVTKMFKDATAAKQRDLRVRTDNPALGVAGPETGDRKSKVYLYPSEFRQLVSCAAIGVEFRTIYAAAVYTFARAGELEALTWGDVDLEHGVIHINKAIDRETGDVKTTKSGETRRIPIEAELAPLLKRLHDARTSDSVLWMPDNEDRAVLLRQHLTQAGAKRADLFADNDRQKHMTFHDLRATGITWMAVRGDDPLRIKQRAGHAAFSTTEMYIREAENLAVGFGDPFPPLPPDLVGPPSPAAPIVPESSEMEDLPRILVEQRGIEPRTSALRTQRSPS